MKQSADRLFSQAGDRRQAIPIVETELPRRHATAAEVSTKACHHLPFSDSLNFFCLSSFSEGRMKVCKIFNTF